MDEVVYIGDGQDLMAMVDNLKEGDTITMINSEGEKVVVEGTKTAIERDIITSTIYAEARRKEEELEEVNNNAR